MRIGQHTSTGGSLERAALKAVELGANTFQIFSASPRMWRTGTRSPDDIRRMQEIRSKHDLRPLVVHDSYLINLASRNPAIRTASIAAFRAEIERSLAMGADYIVAHPGNYKGQCVEEGLLAVVEGLSEAGRGLSSTRLTILLENTVGAGCQLGSRFEELEVMRRLAQEQVGFEIGFCLDTAHCFACGHYDIATAGGLKKSLETAESILGLSRVRVIHCNDSKAAAGTCVDRHQHIGQGHIGLEPFRRLLNHPKLRDKAFILETPVDNPGDDQRNLDTLKSLCRTARQPRESAKLTRVNLGR